MKSLSIKMEKDIDKMGKVNKELTFGHVVSSVGHAHGDFE